MYFLVIANYQDWYVIANGMLPKNEQGHLTIVFWKLIPDFFSANQQENYH